MQLPATAKILGVAAALLTVSSASAQVFYTESFDTSAAGWSGPFPWYSNATACSTGALRENLYSGVTSAVLESPALGTSNGGTTTITYSYKAHLWSANTAPAPSPWGGFNVEYADNAAGPWTNIATITDETQTSSCITKTHTFTPPAGALFVRFDCSWLGGDYYLNFDDITVAEAGANPPATHTSFGSGCYTIETNQAVYQNFPDSASSSAALLGTSITFTPTATGYTLSNGGGTYLAPSVAATVIPLGDDDSAPYTPSIPFPHVGGAVPDLEVHSNCFVSMGPGNANNVYGSVPALLGSPVASFRANFDLDPSIAGAVVSAEEVGSVLYVTWESPRFNFTLAEIERVQMQFNLSTGEVVMVWHELPNLVSTGDTVVGYAPGLSNDPGAIDLATALPITTEPDSIIPALSLSAAPAPVSTGAAGTTVIYTADNIPDAQVNSGVHIAAVWLSLAGDLPGTDLGFLGAGGCSAYLGSLDITLSDMGQWNSSTQNLTVDIPAGVPLGTLFYAQAVSLVFPNSLPNGQNSAGIVTSNGIESFVSDN